MIKKNFFINLIKYRWLDFLGQFNIYLKLQDSCKVKNMRKKEVLVGETPPIIIILKLVSGAEIVGRFKRVINTKQIIIEDPLIMTYTYEDIFSNNPHPRFLKYLPFAKHRSFPFNNSLIITSNEAQDNLKLLYKDAVIALNMSKEEINKELQKIREQSFSNFLQVLEVPAANNTVSWN